MAIDWVGQRIDLSVLAFVSDEDLVDLVCPACGDYLQVTKVSYGWYAICRFNKIRWCKINGDSYAQAERWHPTNNTQQQENQNGRNTAHPDRH